MMSTWNSTVRVNSKAKKSMSHILSQIKTSESFISKNPKISLIEMSKEQLKQYLNDNR